MKVKFWPSESIIPVEVCNHRFDADLTVSFQTDTREASSAHAVEAFGFKNSFRLGCFVSNIHGQTFGAKDCEDTGLVRNDIYFATDYWKNPITGAIELIPDYYSAVWSSAGATFFNVTVGAAKATRFPNHGQQLFDISSGDLGYDLINGVEGANGSLELYGLYDYQNEWFQKEFGRNNSSISFRNGQSGSANQLLKKVLSARNSGAGDVYTSNASETYYGGTLGFRSSTLLDLRDYFKSYRLSTRWWDYWNTYIPGVSEAFANSYLIQELNETSENAGWFKDFAHWHNAEGNDTLESLDNFLSLIKSTLSTKRVHTCSNGEAIEYMFLRQCVQRITAKEKNQRILILTDVINIFEGEEFAGIPKDVFFSQLNTPLTIKIDLTGTHLEGKNIATSFLKPISLGSNQYLVEIPFKSDQSGFGSLIISENSVADYRTLVQPSVSKSVTGNVAIVTSNQRCKYVLFEAPSGFGLKDVVVKSRFQDYQFTHSITFDITKENWVGVISESGQSNLIKL